MPNRAGPVMPTVRQMRRFLMQPAFEDIHDDLPPPMCSHMWARLSLVAVTIGLLGVGLFYFATDGFTRGTLADLGAVEKRAIDEMQDAGILIRDEALPCTMQPHVVIKVRWESQEGRYCVSNIGLRNIEIEKLLPHIDRFVGLRVIDAPYLPSAERDRIARLLPTLQVTGNQ